MGLQLEANVGLTVGDLDEHADRIIAGLKREDPRPFYLSRTATAYQTDPTLPNALAPVVLDLGAPPTGSIWQLRAVITFGTDAFTPVFAVGGTVPVQCALFTGDSLNLSLATLKIPALGIPVTRYVPDTCMWCHPNENLVIMTSSGASAPILGQQIGCNVVVEEWKESDVSRSSGY